MRTKEEKKKATKAFTEEFLKLPESKQMYVIGIIHGLQANAQKVTSSS